MGYQGEHLWVSFSGKAAIAVALICAFAAMAAYLFYVFAKSPSEHLKNFSRLLYRLHYLMIVLSAALLYFAIYNHYFEFNYVWKHSSSDTPVAYIISCFWAGQEGSYLMWLLLQGILGLILIKRAKDHEPLAMAVISGVQFMLLLNIIGIQISGLQIGASPFFLLREVATDPLFNHPDYLSFIVDGNGLNPLLQNPWMVIHPPVIFLGYALTLVPFAYILSALISKDYKVLKPVIAWTVAAVFFLGIGLLLGGAWAYEALTFGGFWAWDPVENASLVPWLVLLAALHLQIIAHKKQIYLIPAFILTAVSFILVIYASFLTRSGILAETSAHSFGRDTSAMPLLILLLISLVLPVALLIIRRNTLKTEHKNNTSLDFIIYLGSLLLVLSAFQIIFTTSVPVINKLFSLQLAPPPNRVAFYNSWQLPFAVIFCVFIASALVFSLKGTLKNLFLPFGATMITGTILVVFLNAHAFWHILLYFAGLFSFFVILDSFLRFWKRISNKTAAFIHLGFAIFILGVLLTFSNKKNLSNSVATQIMPPADESLMLNKGRMTKAGDYFIIYDKKEVQNNRIYFTLNFYRPFNTDSLKYAFSTKPYLVLNSVMGNVYEPDVRKFFAEDVFTYISYVDVASVKDTAEYKPADTLQLTLHDTVYSGNTPVVMDTLIIEGHADTNSIDYLSIKAGIRIDQKLQLSPAYIIKNNLVSFKDDENADLGIRARLLDISNKENTVFVQILTRDNDVVVVKSMVFPYINLMWLGAIMMFAGIFISIIKRSKKKQL